MNIYIQLQYDIHKSNRKISEMNEIFFFLFCWKKGMWGVALCEFSFLFWFWFFFFVNCQLHCEVPLTTLQLHINHNFVTPLWIIKMTVSNSKKLASATKQRSCGIHWWSQQMLYEDSICTSNDATVTVATITHPTKSIVDWWESFIADC